ncbi:MAG: hypothetical protein V8Q42_08530 [Anaerovoracaceae bacterium]
MERLKTFYTKYLRHYIVLLFLIAIAINFVIELLARHSLILTLQFLSDILWCTSAMCS